MLLVNYDQSGKNSESVPVNIVGLSPGSYRFSESDRTNVIESGDKQAADGKFSKTVLMPPFAIKLLEIYLTQSSLPATTGKPQVSVQLQITPEIIPRPLEFTPPQFLLGRGSIEMTFKFKSDPAENKKVTIFQLPTAGAASSKNEFAASKQNSGFGPRLVFGTFENERPKKTLAASILSWKKDEWHDVIFAWNENGLKLTLDKTIAGELKESFQPGFGTVLTFSDSDLSIGTIRITDGGRELSRRTFAVPTAR